MLIVRLKLRIPIFYFVFFAKFAKFAVDKESKYDTGTENTKLQIIPR